MKKFIISLFILLFLNLSAIASDNRIHIAYCIDNNYPLFTMLSINSILLNKDKDSKYMFHIVENNLSAFDKAKMYLFVKSKGADIEFIKINLDVIDNGKNYYEGTGFFYVSRIGTARMLLPELLPDLDKILYLDGDTLVTTNIKELYDIDLKNYYAGMIGDIPQIELKNYSYKDVNYFNSGVILLNVKEWRKNNISKKCINELKNMHESPDQDVINIVLKNKIKPLNYRWNFFVLIDTFKSKKPVIKIPKGIIHFIGGFKPWLFLFSKDYRVITYSKYWDKSILIIYKPIFYYKYIDIYTFHKCIDLYNFLFVPLRNKLIEIPFFEFLIKY